MFTHVTAAGGGSMALKTSLAPESTFQDDGSIFGLSDVSSTSMSNSPREVELGERLGEKPATEGRRAPRKTSSWRSSTGSLAKQRAMTRHLAKKYWEKLDTLDRFAVQPEPASRLGGGLTIFVWGATIIYLIIAVFQWMHKPPIVAANSEWSIDQCVRVPYLDSHRVPMVYTEDPLEGVSVLYDPSSSDDQVLPRFGVTTVSEIQCKPEEGKGCVDYRGSAAGPGVSSVTIVRILNQTEIGAAKHRLLAFSGSSPMNETINTQVTSCKPDPDWEEAAQSCLKMGPVYFDVLVYTDSFWLYLLGSAGGAFSSFVEICTILLIAYHFTSKVYKGKLKNKVARLQQAAYNSWAAGRAYWPKQDKAEGKPNEGPHVWA